MALTSTELSTYLSQPLKRSFTEFEQDQLDHRADSYNNLDICCDPRCDGELNQDNLDQCCFFSHSPPTRLPSAQLSPPAQLTPPTQLPPWASLSRAELTLENLLSHTQSIDPSAAVIMPALSTTSSKTTYPADSPQALAEYGLEMDSREAYPPDVKQYLAQHIQVSPLFSSPKAAKLNGLSKHLSKVSEATMVRLISDLITFSGKWEDEKDGEHYIRLDNNIFLSKQATQPPDKVPCSHRRPRLLATFPALSALFKLRPQTPSNAAAATQMQLVTSHHGAIHRNLDDLKEVGKRVWRLSRISFLVEVSAIL